jgi:hypothetical protein
MLVDGDGIGEMTIGHEFFGAMGFGGEIVTLRDCEGGNESKKKSGLQSKPLFRNQRHY